MPGGSAGGSGGVTGGFAGAEPMSARPADLARVGETIARSLVYPPRARRMRWEGRVVLAFVLLADGRIRDLRVALTSGFPLLDEAALVAVEKAVPFPPPGVAVRVEIPVAFRL